MPGAACIFRPSAGFAYDDLAETRYGYLNYVGDDLGVQGAVRRDQANYTYDFDQYLQSQWDPDALWRVTAGVRNNFVEVSSNDHLAGTHSSVRYTAVSPVGGVVFHAAPAVNLYASYGKGFETPTLNDLAYRSADGSLPGLNTALKAARSNNYEVGVKAGKGAIRAELAGFYIETHDELAVLQNFNGRTVEQNIGDTARHGVEFAVDADLNRRLFRACGLYVHPRGRRTGVPNLCRDSVFAGHGLSGKLSARGAPQRALSGSHLEL